MLNSIFFIILIFLSLIGISEVICFFASFLFRSKVKPKKYLFVKLTELDAEQQVLFEIFKIRWYGDKFTDKIVFLTDDLSLEKQDFLLKEYASEMVEFKNGVINERE